MNWVYENETQFLKRFRIGRETRTWFASRTRKINMGCLELILVLSCERISISVSNQSTAWHHLKSEHEKDPTAGACTSADTTQLEWKEEDVRYCLPTMLYDLVCNSPRQGVRSAQWGTRCAPISSIWPDPCKKAKKSRTVKNPEKCIRNSHHTLR